MMAVHRTFNPAHVGPIPTGHTIHRCRQCGEPVGKGANYRQKQFCDASCFGHWNNAQRSAEVRSAVATAGGQARGRLWKDERWLARYYALSDA